MRPRGVSRACFLRVVDVAEQPVLAIEGGEERLSLGVVGTLEAEGDRNMLLHVDGCIGSKEGRGDAVSHGAGCGRPEGTGGSRGLRRFRHDGLARLIARSRGMGRRRCDEVGRLGEAAAWAVRQNRADGLVAAWAARQSRAAGAVASGRRTGAAEGTGARLRLCGAMARALEAGIVVQRAVLARPGGTACRAGPITLRALTGCRAVPLPCPCLGTGPRHGPWATFSCRAARWARPFSPGRAGPWPAEV